MQEISETSSETADQQIKTAQRQAAMDKSATEILAEKARKDATNTLATVKTDKEKFTSASNFFFGAYFLNTRTRGEYCASLGININSFVIAYKQRHESLFIAAERYQIEDFKENGDKYDIDQFYKVMSPALGKYLAQDMKDIATTQKISEREVCQSLEQNAAQWVDQMGYERRFPEGAQVLLQK